MCLDGNTFTHTVSCVVLPGCAVCRYSFMLWEQIIAPECLYADFVDKNGHLRTDMPEALQTTYDKCYGRRTRILVSITSPFSLAVALCV